MDENSTGPQQPVTVAEEPAPPSPAAPWYRRPGPLALATAVVAAAGIGIGVGLAGHSTPFATPAAAETTSAPSTILLSGSLTVPFLGTDLFAPQAVDPSQPPSGAPMLGDPCITQGGFTDITAGAAVTIGGPDGKTIAVGALEAGQVAGTAGQPAQCEFDFSVQVPQGLAEYTVTVSHRGTEVFTPEQVLQGEVKLTLGAP